MRRIASPAVLFPSLSSPSRPSGSAVPEQRSPSAGKHPATGHARRRAHARVCRDSASLPLQDGKLRVQALPRLTRNPQGENAAFPQHNG